MQYDTGHEIGVGDEVIADGMRGWVVCDFDSRQFAEGYEGWDMPTTELVGGGTLSSGIMIDTVEAGLIHYVEGTGTIARISS